MKLAGLVLATLVLSQPCYAMTPQVAAILAADAQLVYYRNFAGNWSFNGYLYANNIADPHLVGGKIYPNGQGLFEIPNLSLGQCMIYTLQSWGQMVGLLIDGKGRPYGPNQMSGGCTDISGNPPEDVDQNEMASCDTPYNGGNNFAYPNLSRPQVGEIGHAPGATCQHCAQGPWWYPCQAGLIGCANPPVPGTCTPFHF